MSFRLPLAVPLTLLCAGFLLSTTSCDFSSGGSSSNNGLNAGPGTSPGSGGGDCFESPILQSAEGLDTEICPGEFVTLRGVNFSADLSENEILFRGSGNVQLVGVPVTAIFPTDGDCSNGTESTLVVAVPSGVVSGNLEVRVNGIFAGGFGYSACPQILAFELGRDGSQPNLTFFGLLGFDPNAFVRIIGLNFQGISEIELEDSQGTTARIPANVLERNVGGDSTNSGYSRVGFPLNDDNVEVRLLVQGPRDNLQVTARGQDSSSNTIQVPVNVDGSTEEGGSLAISGIRLPVGGVTGPVRFRYSLYEEVIGAAHNVLLEWRPVSGFSPADDWFPAAPDLDDPEHDGSEGILAGPFAVTTGFGLLPVRGTMRTFTWNPSLDDNFPPDDITPGAGARSAWAIEFRLSTSLGVGSGRPPPHEWISPPILYVDLSDEVLGEGNGDQRMAAFEEDFQNVLGQVVSETDARWAQPVGSLSGALIQPFPDAFGQGTFPVIFDPPPRNEPVEQFFTLDTDTMRAEFTETFENDPDDVEDDETRVVPFNLRNTAEGTAANEFHWASMTITEGTRVIARGENPLIIRLSGPNGSDEEEVVLTIEPGAVLDLCGRPGQNSPRLDASNNPVSVSSAGPGGAAGAGGGGGGNGAEMELEDAASPTVVSIEPAAAGGLNGGGGGETTGAINFRNLTGEEESKFYGGPGGGGGNRLPGGTGDSGNPVPSEYRPARAGLGGDARGGPFNALLQPGSGGGGGGATISSPTSADSRTPVAGAGGGGGGGAVLIVADGTLQIDGAILAAGGRGGDGVTRLFDGRRPTGTSTGLESPGAGGGGSGGNIVLQATGGINVSCSGLSVEGGGHGRADIRGNEDVDDDRLSVQNRIPGSGDGGPGWIRVEPGIGGAPLCATLVAETFVQEALEPSDVDEMLVDDVSGFPASGGVLLVTAVVTIVDEESGTIVEEVVTEEIGYTRTFVKATDVGVERKFLALTRSLNGEGPFSFNGGGNSRVVLKGPVSPTIPGTEVLSENGAVSIPSGFPEFAGRDGPLTLRFIQSVNPETDEPIRDRETSEFLSIYTMDTGTGVILDPNGNIVRSPGRNSQNPTNVLDLLQLKIDAGAVLKIIGEEALVMHIADVGDISGRIEVSGEDGGLLRFRRDNLANPLPGLPGGAGPGGGPGGQGGTFTFRDGDANNKIPENIVVVPGDFGGIPEGLPPGIDQTPSPVGGGNPEGELAPPPSVIRPSAGATLRGGDCGSETPALCEDRTAGGGAGGGNVSGGNPGEALPESTSESTGGEPGSAFGVSSWRFEGEVWPYGGTGASGGGGFPNVSTAYRAGETGESLNPSTALYAPGTGGGGGGGSLRIVATNLTLRSSARLMARGGNAFQSIDLGGNGGGGAGGSIILQIRDSLTIQPGATIDVNGGRANLPVPPVPGVGLPEYEGNIRLTGQFDQIFESFGGLGGDGAAGQVRIEVDGNSLAGNPELSSPNPSLVAGPSTIRTVISQALSRPAQLGVGDSLLITSHDLTLHPALVRFGDFGQPPGTTATILWEGAAQSLDRHAVAGDFSPGVEDVSFLRDSQFVRFRVIFASNVESGDSPSIRSITLPYSLVLPPPLPDFGG